MTICFRILGFFMLCLSVGACADENGDQRLTFDAPETQVSYEVDLLGVSDESVKALMEQSLELFRRQSRGAQSLAFLRRRATDDIATAQKILRSFGWYEADVSVEVLEATPDDAAAEQSALARMKIAENRRYVLRDHRIILTDVKIENAPEARALGSPVGGPATAADILAAEAEAVRALQAAGRPYAARLNRKATADPENAELEVQTNIVAGREYRFGDVSYQGGDGVNRDYLDTYRTWTEGERVDPARLKAFQNALIATGLFEAAAAGFPEEPPEGEVAPVEVRLEEAQHRTISGGVRFNTDTGPAVRGGFEHRNLFGANETILLEATAGLQEQVFGAEYLTPQYLRSGQNLVLDLELRRIEDEAFDEIGGTFSAGIERELNEVLTLGFGGLIEVSRTTGDRETEVAQLLGAPAFIAYDTSDDRLDPTKGKRARLTLTPIAGLQDGKVVSFGVIDANAAAYFDLTGEETYVLAVRGRLASIVAGDLDIVSEQRRLYSGGGGSVRGYEERFIGPLDSDDDPTGGLSAAELGVEVRAKFTPEIGAVGFVEAGSVSENTAPGFEDGVQIAVGGGLRYFSLVGPLRFDIGFPINGRRVDDDFQFYISIGQAF